MIRNVSECGVDQLKGLLANRLAANEVAMLEDHLSGCPHCRETLEALASDRSWWSDLATLDPREVEGILEQDEPARLPLGFLEPSDREGSLGRLGPYEVQSIIGQGGMGVVLKGFDPALNRPVAIKVISPLLALVATARRRFAREARAAAAVSHDHIVAIHAVAESASGLPYLVMPLIVGRSLQERIDRDGPLEVPEILRIGMQTASGLAAAHAQGLVHRDVKPANLLLENGVERVKITDFGLARAADDASLTQSVVIAGTPQYMAPEQASAGTVDHRGDLFSLGAVLYACATGHSPFRAPTTMAVLKRVCEESPRPIRQINPSIPGWLEAIIFRLLEKDPERRFPSASEVADLFRQGLAHLERPATEPAPRSPRVVTGTGRGRRLVVAAVVLILGLSALGVASAGGISPAWNLLATVLRLRTPEGTLVVEVDDPEIKIRIDDEDLVIQGAGPQEIRLAVGQHRLAASKGGKPVRQELVSISRDEKKTVVVNLEPDLIDGEVPAEYSTNNNPNLTDHPAIRRDFQSASIEHAAPFHPVVLESARSVVLKPFDGQPCWWALFSHDGKKLITSTNWSGLVKFIDVETRAEVGRLTGQPNTALSCGVLSPDGTLLATGGAYQIHIWDADGRKLVTSSPRHTAPVRALAFSPDGRTLVSASDDGIVKFWEVGTWKERSHELTFPTPCFAVAFSPDGKTLAFGTGHFQPAKAPFVTLFDFDEATGTGRERQRLAVGNRGPAWSIAFSPDGKSLATSSFDTTIRLWDVASGNEVGFLPLLGKRPGARGLTFSPDGRMLAAGVFDGDVALWDVGSRRRLATLRGHRDHAFTVQISPDGRRLVSAGKDGTVRLWGLDRIRP